MITRRSLGHRPQLTFTSDGHELVQGDLLPGVCVLRYDAHRIVPHELILASPDLPIPVVATIRTHPGGETKEIALQLTPGRLLEAIPNPSAQGTMLKADVLLPLDCEALECWFRYQDSNGETYWDSAQGRNFHLRFPTHDLPVINAQVRPDPKAIEDTFLLEVESINAVDSLVVRWRSTQVENDFRHETTLVATASSSQKKTWTAPQGSIKIPCGSTIVFDLVYAVGGHFFTDDNEGTWYLPT